MDELPPIIGILIVVLIKISEFFMRNKSDQQDQPLDPPGPENNFLSRPSPKNESLRSTSDQRLILERDFQGTVRIYGLTYRQVKDLYRMPQAR